jgi:S-adenosylmethionine:tRNA ribosyltransferase-isomerase
MKLSDFQYDLPQELIAQFPLEDRAAARMLVVNRQSGELLHTRFACIIDFLQKGDALVLNNTRVFKARLKGTKPTGGAIEILLIQEIAGGLWETMITHMKRAQEGTKISIGIDSYITIEKKTRGARVVVRFSKDPTEIIDTYGLVPLPHYIKREPVTGDEEHYQTTFAKSTGSIAAPTAGLHFTEQLLDEIHAKGTTVSEITLHIGPGTFKPIRTTDIEEHRMDAEYYEISDAALPEIKSAKRIVAAGTSVCRALETYSKTGDTNGWANLFIYPGYKFKLIDCLVTNFHMPGSTPLLLVCAFAGKNLIFKAYAEAIKEKYRFLSYGDAMLIV